ncbi:MAG: hypothetical protein E6I52_11685 [Chloroflexi bacterium]|nr:MAG: hypothetical protein E6I52_11685 [Chloroflexota bacterium]
MNADLFVPLASAQLELTEERKAALMPKLQALLTDFSQLALLERSDLEPVTTDWLVRSYRRAR